MVWQPTGSLGTGPAADDVRCGTQRSTMKTNLLLAKAELGKVKPCTFSNAPQDHVFGYTMPVDPEGAREVTGIWKEHNPSSAKTGRTDGKPVPDFKAMNKISAISGVTTAKELPTFRSQHLVTVKKFDHTRKQNPVLPSDKNGRHTYGMPSAYRTADTVRNCGPQEPPMKHLIQGAYQDEWIRTNHAKDATATTAKYVPPVPTRAAIGHAIGAQRYLRPECHGEEWKMSKFRTVGPKVTQYMTGTKGFDFNSSSAYEEAPMTYEVEQHRDAACEVEAIEPRTPQFLGQDE